MRIFESMLTELYETSKYEVPYQNGMNSSISLEKSLGDDIEDFHEKLSMHEPSSDAAGIYSFQTKLLTASDLKKLETKHQEFFKTFSKKSFHIDYKSLLSNRIVGWSLEPAWSLRHQ